MPLKSTPRPASVKQRLESIQKLSLRGTKLNPIQKERVLKVQKERTPKPVAPKPIVYELLPVDRQSPYTGMPYTIPVAGDGGPFYYHYAEFENDKVRLLNCGVVCRDYMVDYFLDAVDYPPSARRYGQAPNDGKLRKEGDLILVVTGESLKRFLSDLHALEDKYGVKRTQVFNTNYSQYLVVIADEFWKRTSLHMSCYLQILRHMYTGSAWKTPVGNNLSLMTLPTYWGDFWSFLDLVAQLKPLDKWRNYLTNTHGTNGYYSFCFATAPAMHLEASRKKFEQIYHYYPQLYALRKEQQKACAASPATVS